MRRRTTGSRVSAKFLHRPTRSLRRKISLLSTFGAVAGVQLQTSRSIKPRERDLGDLRVYFLVRFLTRPTNHPRHAACASNHKSKPVRPHFLRGQIVAQDRHLLKACPACRAVDLAKAGAKSNGSTTRKVLRTPRLQQQLSNGGTQRL